MLVENKSRKFCLYFAYLIIVLSYLIADCIISKVGEPFIQGFYCDGENNKPYKNSTVPTVYLIIVIVCISMFFFGLGEGEFLQFEEKGKIWLRENGYLKTWAVNVALLILMCLYGGGISIFITAIGKYTIGRPRPHFITVCKPNWKEINCTNSFGRKNLIMGDEFCTTGDKAALRYARLGFPSGHAAGSAYGATFLILYIEYRIKCEKWGSVSKLFVQVAICCGAFYVALTRVSDYMNYASDVITGFLIGILVGIVLQYVVIRRFFPRRNKRTYDVLDEDTRMCGSSDVVEGVSYGSIETTDQEP